MEFTNTTSASVSSLEMKLVSQQWGSPYHEEYLVICFEGIDSKNDTGYLALYENEPEATDSYLPSCLFPINRYDQGMIVTDITKKTFENKSYWLAHLDLTNEPEKILKLVKKLSVKDKLPPHGGLAANAHPMISPKVLSQLLATESEAAEKTTSVSASNVGFNSGFALESLFLTVGSFSIFQSPNFVLNWKCLSPANDDYVALADHEPKDAYDYIQTTYVYKAEDIFNTGYRATSDTSAFGLIRDLTYLEKFWIMYCARDINGKYIIVRKEKFKKYENWMRDSMHDIGKFKLPQIAIPGTHDSGCYSISFALMAQTQNMDFGQQLEMGIRYLDCRFENDGNKNYTIFHNIAGTSITLQDFLMQVDKFIYRPGNQEIIILDFNGFGDKFDHDDFIKQVLGTLSNGNTGKIALADDVTNETIEDLVQNDKRVVICYGNDTIKDKYGFLNSINITKQWANTSSVDVLETFLDGQVNSQAKFSQQAWLWTLQGILTYAGWTGLVFLAQQANPSMGRWLLGKKTWIKQVNIVFSDFCLGNRIPECALEINAYRTAYPLSAEIAVIKNMIFANDFTAASALLFIFYDQSYDRGIREALSGIDKTKIFQLCFNLFKKDNLKAISFIQSYFSKNISDIIEFHADGFFLIQLLDQDSDNRLSVKENIAKGSWQYAYFSSVGTDAADNYWQMRLIPENDGEYFYIELAGHGDNNRLSADGEIYGWRWAAFNSIDKIEAKNYSKLRIIPQNNGEYFYVALSTGVDNTLSTDIKIKPKSDRGAAFNPVGNPKQSKIEIIYAFTP